MLFEGFNKIRVQIRYPTRFLNKLGMKPCIHTVQISMPSSIGPTKITSNLLKHLKGHFSVLKNWLNLCQIFFYEYWTRRPTFTRKCFYKFWFFQHFIFKKCAQFLLPLFITLLGLTMTWFSIKMLISTRWLHDFMTKLFKKSWTSFHIFSLPFTDRK